MSRKGKRARQAILTVGQRFQVEVLGFSRDGVRIKESQARHGDDMFFVLPHADTTVYRGRVGPKGNIVDLWGTTTGESNLMDILQELGCPKRIKTATIGEISAIRTRGQPRVSGGGGSNRSPRPPSGLPADVDELMTLLKGTHDKGDKRRIRAALRAMGHTGGLKSKGKK